MVRTVRAWLWFVCAAVVLVVCGGRADGQMVYGPPAVMPSVVQGNPAYEMVGTDAFMMGGGGREGQGFSLPGLPGVGGGDGAWNPLHALEAAGSQLPGAEGGEGLSVGINIVILLTVITLVPSLMLMTTSFVRIIVVLGLVKQAMGTQSLPPPQVITGLALMMTLLVMSPTIDRIYEGAVVPYQNGEIRDHGVLWERVKQPMRDFMFDQIEVTGNWSSLYMVLNYRGIDTSEPEALQRADVDMISLVPAFMLSELKTAFLMGFRVYLPFLVIDMVIASLLISMSMMMLPPVLISLPFKLLLFVLVDGWQLVVGSLMTSFVNGGDQVAAGVMVVGGSGFV